MDKQIKPRAPEAEQSVIGGLLLDNNTIERIGVSTHAGSALAVAITARLQIAEMEAA